MIKNRTISLRSPAKVNLFLKVLNKREDGYHNIISIVDIISIFDRITIKEVDDDNVIVNDNKGILPEGRANTLFKAATLIKERYNIKNGIEIFIEKNKGLSKNQGNKNYNEAK